MILTPSPVRSIKGLLYLGWLRLVKILLLKRLIEGDSVKTLDSDGKALAKIHLFLSYLRLSELDSAPSLR